MDFKIFPPEEMIEATISLPLSKSICNRLLIINALTPGSSPLERIADCDDSAVLRAALDSLNSVQCDTHVDVNIGAAGTAMRFITAYIAATPGLEATVDGTERMRHRPIAVLVDALRRLGAKIEYAGEEGFPPLRISGTKLSGGDISIDATVSSQYISALMMVGPTMSAPLTISLEGEISSRPYIVMTKELMNRAGAEVDFSGSVIEIARKDYCNISTEIEPDWSAASYWYEIAAVTAGFITLPGLEMKSLQGDARCSQLFELLGVVTSESEDVENALEIAPSPEQFSRFEKDLSDTPDLAQTLAVTAALLGIPFHLRGLASLRVKETDRLEALKNELDKLGIIVEIRGDSELIWNGERHPIFEMPRIATYDDHRMAMAFAPAAYFIPGMVVENVEVVSKSYPGFWDDLRIAGFTFEEETASAEAPPAP